MTPADALIAAAAAYALAGAVFAAWLLPRRVARLDPVAARSSRAFRLLIAPGVVALWPLLARRLARRMAPLVAPASRDMEGPRP